MAILFTGFGSSTIAVLYDHFKPRQPSQPSPNGADISSFLAELVAERMVEQIKEELGSALGGGASKSKGVWIACQKGKEEDFTLSGDVSGLASEYLGLGVGFHCIVVNGDLVERLM